MENRPPPAYDFKTDPQNPSSSLASSSSKRPIQQPITYTLHYTSKSSRTFGGSLPARLVQNHTRFDPSVPSACVRVIINYMHNAYGNSLHVGGGGGDDHMSHGYVRVEVEVPAGYLGDERKQVLMHSVMGVVDEYEGKKAGETEVQVVVRELEEGNQIWRPARLGNRAVIERKHPS